MGYAANVDAVNSTPFGDFSVDNTPQSQASSMFGNALKAQVEQQQNLAKEQQQAATMLGYQQNPTGPNYGALFAGDPNARLTSQFGVRDHPIDGVTKMHYGVDIAAPSGSSVTSATNGEVTFAGTKPGYGNVVEVTDENGNRYTFGHLGNLGVKTGDKISAGDILGRQGRTGKATGEHLHYGVTDNTGRQVNPATFHGWGG